MDNEIIEFFNRVESYQMRQADRSQLFSMHNRLFPDKMEHSKNCGSCRLRVYNKVKELYYQLIAKK
jgi:hypothetical protein